MKIGICWSHWTGKSTLFNLIDYPNKINETARDTIEILGNPQSMDNDELYAFQKIVLIKQIIKEKEYEKFISDRTVYDILAYSRKLHNYHSLYDKIKNHQWYDIVFYIPIEFPMEQDWVRFENPKYQKVVDKRVKKLMKDNNIKYITITWTAEERAGQIQQHLS